MKNWKSYLNPLWVFILASIASRWPTFFNYWDKDEGTYIAIAQELNAGARLYLDVMDLKPPLGLWIFQWMEAIFDERIYLYRLLLSILIGLMAWMIFQIQDQLGGSRKAAWLSGLLFIFLHYFQFAMTFNFEYLMNFFTVLGVLIYVSSKKKFLAGLVLGLSFCVKYLCLLDFLALIFLILYESRNKNGRKMLLSLFSAGAGFILPFFLVNLYFANQGLWEEFNFVTYIAPGNYSSETTFLEKLQFIVDFHITHLLYFILFYLTLFTKGVTATQKWFYSVWFLATLTATQMTGQQFKHYLLQVMPALSLMAGAVADSQVKWLSGISHKWCDQKNTFFKAGALMALLFLAASIFNYFDHFVEKEPLPNVANYLDNNMNESDLIYAANCCSYLYSKCDRRPLNEYVHGSLLVRDVHIRTLDIDVDKELLQIQHAQPEYVVVKNEYRWPRFRQFLEEKYTLVLKARKGYRILQKKAIKR